MDTGNVIEVISPKSSMDTETRALLEAVEYCNYFPPCHILIGPH